jgi:hypothetical protein
MMNDADLTAPVAIVEATGFIQPESENKRQTTERNMSPKEASRKLQTIYRLMREGTIVIKLNKNLPHFAQVEFFEDHYEITLNPTLQCKGGIVSSLLHELLHCIYYDSSETEILRMEKEMYNALTNRQLTNLMRRAGVLFRKER